MPKVEAYIKRASRRLAPARAELADELAQEGRLRVELSLRADPSLAPGLQCHGARCAMIDALRSELRHKVYKDATLGPDGRVEPYAPEDLDIEQELRAILARVETLPDRERAIFRAYHMDQKPVKDIADAMGLSQSTVTRALRSARATLAA